MALPLLVVPVLILLLGKKSDAAPVQQGIVVGDYHPPVNADTSNPADIGSVSSPVDAPLAHDMDTSDIAAPVIAQTPLVLPKIPVIDSPSPSTLVIPKVPVIDPIATSRAAAQAQAAAQAAALQAANDARAAAAAAAQQQAADRAAAQQLAAQQAADRAAAYQAEMVQEREDYLRGQALAAANARSNGYDEGYQQLADSPSYHTTAVNQVAPPPAPAGPYVPDNLYPLPTVATPTPAPILPSVPASTPLVSVPINPGARYQPNRAN